MTREETREWRRTVAEELKLVKRQTKITTDYIYEKNKIYKIIIVIGLVLSIFAVKLVFIGDKDALTLLILLSVLELIFAGIIMRRSSKAKFMLKSCEEEKFWVRDLVVVNKEFFIQPYNRRKRDDSYIIHANIVNSVEKGDNARRTYYTTESVYKHLSIGRRFLDARYDDDLSGKPYLIIEQIWNVEQ